MNIKKLEHTQFPLNTERIILLAGNGQNVGKTTFACLLIEHIKNLNQKVYSLKISPHFHDQNPLNCIYKGNDFILSLEKKRGTGKDSSRYLDAGADESFFLQVKDEKLEEAIKYSFSFFPKETIIVVESGGLRNILKPKLFFFLLKQKDTKMKEKAKDWPGLADKVIAFDGAGFDFAVDKIQLKNDELSILD